MDYNIWNIQCFILVVCDKTYFIYYPDSLVLGTDTTQVSIDNVFGCSAYCLNDLDCYGFNFNSHTAECYIFDEPVVDGVEYFDGLHHFRHICS